MSMRRGPCPLTVDVVGALGPTTRDEGSDIKDASGAGSGRVEGGRAGAPSCNQVDVTKPDARIEMSSRSPVSRRSARHL
eukprot:scaffold17471_cov115-Isochrysis_galbana.AAC.4